MRARLTQRWRSLRGGRGDEDDLNWTNSESSQRGHKVSLLNQSAFASRVFPDRATPLKLSEIAAGSQIELPVLTNSAHLDSWNLGERTFKV